MELKLDWRRFADELEIGGQEANYFLSIMYVILEDYLKTVEAEKFRERFGDLGTLALSKFVVK